MPQRYPFERIRHFYIFTQQPNASEKIDSFPGRFFVFATVLLFFRVFCLVEMIYFVYLHIVKGVSIIFHPEPIIFKKT